MNLNNNPQLVQENKYNFPYHHLITISRNHFSQNKNIKWGYEYAAYISFVIKQLKNMEYSSLIDIGCGDGKFLNELNKRSKRKFLSGIDYSKKAISFAKLLSPNISFICKDISKEDAVNKKYNIATLIETLEHIPPNNINVFIKNISSLINKKGYLLISVPSDIEKVDSHHFQHFDKNKLNQVINEYFTIKKIFYLNKTSKNVTRLSKLFTNKYFILNNKRLINILYNFYYNNYLIAQENNARRIVAICQKNG